MDSKTNTFNFVGKEAINKNNLEQIDTVSRFIDGIIIYNKNSFRRLTNHDSYGTKVKKTKSLVENKKSTRDKSFNKTNETETNNSFFVLIILILLISFVFIGGIFYPYRKKMCKKGRFKKSDKNKYSCVKKQPL